MNIEETKRSIKRWETPKDSNFIKIFKDNEEKQIIEIKDKYPHVTLITETI